METRIHFIGDVHGKINELDNIISKIPSYEEIFQVGDLGLGFINVPNYYSNFHFIRGNHDSPDASRKHINYLGDYGKIILSVSGKRMFFIGGAYSIDGHSRVEGISYWKDEELDYQTLESVIEQCIQFNPDIVMTHDCPFSLYQFIQKRTPVKSKTNLALDVLFSKFQPKIWVFGHHHKHFDYNIDGTHFVGLGELETQHIIISGKRSHYE